MANYPATNDLNALDQTNPGPTEDASKISDALLETRRTFKTVIEKQHDSQGNILPGSVSLAMLADGIINDTVIQEGGVTNTSIADGTITTVELANGAVTNPIIAQNAVTGGATGSLALATIQEANMAPSSVGTNELINASITAVKLATGLNLGSNLGNYTVPLTALNPGGAAAAEVLIVDQTQPTPTVTAVVPSGDLTMDHTGKFSLTTTATPVSRMPVIIVSDVQNAGTAGQSLYVFVSGTPPPPNNQGGWNIRNLNTLYDPNSLTSINSNMLLVPAGTYLVDAIAPAYQVNAHRAILVSVPVSTASDPTTWKVLLVGSNATANSSNGVQDDSEIQGVITIANPCYLAILHQVTTNGSGGVACNFSPPTVGIFPNLVGMSVNAYVEVYTTMQLLKVA